MSVRRRGDHPKSAGRIRAPESRPGDANRHQESIAFDQSAAVGKLHRARCCAGRIPLLSFSAVETCFEGCRGWPSFLFCDYNRHQYRAKLQRWCVENQRRAWGCCLAGMAKPCLTLTTACGPVTPMTELPPGTQLTVETEPRSEDIKFLEASLYEFNARTTGIFDGQLLGVFARAPDGSPIAGALGWTWGGTCYLRYLFVQEAARGRGQGTALMQAVEKEARSRNCRQIVL